MGYRAMLIYYLIMKFLLPVKILLIEIILLFTIVRTIYVGVIMMIL